MQVEFEGKIHEFPDDFTEADIAAALGEGQEFSALGEATAPFQGFNTGLDAVLNLPGAALNLGAQAVNYGAEKLGYDRPLSDQPFAPVPFATNFNTEYQPQTTAGRYGQTIGELAGGAILPEAGIAIQASRMAPAALRTAAPIMQRAAQAGPVSTLKSSVVPTVGAGVGVQGARDLDLGPLGEVAGGLVGGFGASVAHVPAARVGGALKDAARYGNEQVRAARNPEEAAFQRTADSMVDANTAPSEVRSQLLKDAQGKPLLSKELVGRGITEEDLSNIISRRMSGDSAESIAAEYDLAPSTIDTYVKRLGRETATPMNLVDLATEMRGPGGAMPLLRQGRAAYGITDDSATTAEALYNRQFEQPGRVVEAIQQSSVKGRNFEQELDRLSTTAREEAKQAYTKAKADAQPVNIANVISETRAKFPMEGGRVSEQMNRAVDLFFTKGMVEGTGDKLRYGVSDIVNDVPTYLRRRYELDQMISESFEGMKATPLTAELTQFRQQLNAAARSNNEALRLADAKFSGDRAAEKILAQGQELSKNLTPKTKEAMRSFHKMTPTQQELFRVSFEDRMASLALETREGAGAANRFSTPAFKKLVEAFYPKSAGKDVHKRGQDMLRKLRREAITTGTGNFITGRGNSPTAPWAADIDAQMQNARAAADLATGRFGRLLENLSNRLARQIGQDAASAQLRILTETDLPALLRLLNRLDNAAKGTAERRQLVHQLRELRKPSLLRPGTTTGTATAAEQR